MCCDLNLDTEKGVNSLNSLPNFDFILSSRSALEKRGEELLQSEEYNIQVKLQTYTTCRKKVNAQLESWACTYMSICVYKLHGANAWAKLHIPIHLFTHTKLIIARAPNFEDFATINISLSVQKSEVVTELKLCPEENKANCAT